MAWGGRDRISYRIIWVMIVSMVAFTVAMWVLFSLAYRYAIKGVMNEYVLTSASELATEIRLVVNADVNELKSLSLSDGFRSMDPTQLQLGLRKLVIRTDSPFLSAYVTDSKGNVMAMGSSSRGEDDPFGGMTLPKTALRAVLQGGDYVSGFSPGNDSKGYYPKPFWVAAVPVMDSAGSVSGVLVGLADMGRIQDLVAKLVAKRRLGNSGAAYLADDDGTILVRVDQSHNGRPDFGNLARTVAPGSLGVAVAEVNGVRTIYARASLQDEGWGVLVGMDEAELLAGYHRLTVAVIFGSILFLSILVGASVRQINRILAPLSDLRSAVAKVGTGDYSIRVKVDSSDEIGALAITFNSMVGQVRETERAKTEFISLASHELRTPLTSIKGFASTLLRRDVDWDDASKQEFLQTIDSEADWLGRLVSDMLDVSRIDLGRLEFRHVRMQVGDIAGQVAKRVATMTEKHRFFFEMPETVPEVWGDRDRVEQVLHNLYSNAIKYSPSGGSINTSVSLSRDGTRVRVAISDQGIGIPEDKLDMVFDRFYRVKDSKTSESGGTGLGLYIAKNLIMAMGGTIKAESMPSKGSTFTFTLPVADSLGEVSA